jgi:hypothetical protein
MKGLVDEMEFSFEARTEVLIEEITEQMDIYWQQVGMDLVQAAGGEGNYNDAVDGFKDLVMDRLSDVFYSNGYEERWKEEIRDIAHKMAQDFTG